MAAARLLAAGLVTAVAVEASFTANVLSYGGRGDGRFLNTAAINNAVNAIASQRGGTLYFPPGIFLSGPFNLTSNLVLLLDAATLVADPDIASWPLIAPLPSYGQGRDHTNITWERYGPFIGAYDVTNIAITTGPRPAARAQGCGPLPPGRRRRGRRRTPQAHGRFPQASCGGCRGRRRRRRGRPGLRRGW
jgi:hypothetical protein